MALLDIVFSDGDKQNFINEVPPNNAQDYLDIVLSNSIQVFVLELGEGDLNSPIDWVIGSQSNQELFFHNLTLNPVIGISYIAF